MDKLLNQLIFSVEKLQLTVCVLLILHLVCADEGKMEKDHKKSCDHLINGFHGAKTNRYIQYMAA